MRTSAASRSSRSRASCSIVNATRRASPWAVSFSVACPQASVMQSCDCRWMLLCPHGAVGAGESTAVIVARPVGWTASKTSSPEPEPQQHARRRLHRKCGIVRVRHQIEVLPSTSTTCRPGAVRWTAGVAPHRRRMAWRKAFLCDCNADFLQAGLMWLSGEETVTLGAAAGRSSVR